MYQLFVQGHFDAAHYLRHYQGKCENLHGHRFKVILRLNAIELDETGMAYDFARMKSHLREVLVLFDHACLNDISPFDKIEPSCENLAATIYNRLQPCFSESPVTLACTEVWESPTSGATYSP